MLVRGVLVRGVLVPGVLVRGVRPVGFLDVALPARAAALQHQGNRRDQPHRPQPGQHPEEGAAGEQQGCREHDEGGRRRPRTEKPVVLPTPVTSTHQRPQSLL